MGTACQFRNNTAIFFMHLLVGNKIGKDFSILANRSRCFITGRFDREISMHMEANVQVGIEVFVEFKGIDLDDAIK